MKNKLFTLFFALVASVTMARAEIISGTCGAQGDNLTWEFNTETGVLTISGTGEMADYTDYNYTDNTVSNPWSSYRSSITSVVIMDGVTSIGEAAFYHCSSLTSVTIPYSVTYIRMNVFAGCTDLTSIEIPNSVTSIGATAFYKCKSLITVTIPNSVTSIGSGTFMYCSGLTSVTIPNSLTSIEWGTFCGCSSLISVTIPNSVTYIGQEAFTDCYSLTSVTCLATAPPQMGTSEWNEVVFQNLDCSQIPLYVPAGSIDAYKAADQWKDFINILPIGQGIDQITNNQLPMTNKVIRDGQIYILHGDMIFNASGMRVK